MSVKDTKYAFGTQFPTKSSGTCTVIKYRVQCEDGEEFAMELFKGKDEYGDSLKILFEQLWEYQEAEANLMVEIATIHYENGDTDNTNRTTKPYEIQPTQGFKARGRRI